MIIPHEAWPYIKRQRASCKTLAHYGDMCEREAIAIVDALRSFRPRTIVDIGCGIAGLTAALAREWRADEVLLIDRDDGRENPRYGYRERSDYYSSLDLAQRVVEVSAPITHVTTQRATDDGFISWSQVDMVISTLSCGFHYPLATYLPDIRKVLRPSGWLVVDLRKDVDHPLSPRQGVTIGEGPKHTRSAFPWAVL